MREIISDCLDPKLLSIIEMQWANYSRELSSTGYVEITDGPYMTLFSTTIPNTEANGVVLARLLPEKLDIKIEEAKEFFKSRGLPWTWYIGPFTRPLDLGKHLEGHGFTQVYDMPCMALELAAMNDMIIAFPGFRAEEVTNVDQLKDYYKVMAVVFPEIIGRFKEYFFKMDAAYGFGVHLPKRNYVGYLDGKPVASSTLILGHGVVGLFNISTIAEARCKGLGTEMTLVLLREALSLGYRVGVLHSSDMGYPVYRKIGFKEYCKIYAYQLSE